MECVKSASLICQSDVILCMDNYMYAHPNIKQKAKIFNCKWADSLAVSVRFAAKLLQRS